MKHDRHDRLAPAPKPDDFIGDPRPAFNAIHDEAYKALALVPTRPIDGVRQHLELIISISRYQFDVTGTYPQGRGVRFGEAQSVPRHSARQEQTEVSPASSVHAANDKRPVVVGRMSGGETGHSRQHGVEQTLGLDRAGFEHAVQPLHAE
jgi:hypothetical protein